MILRRPPGRWPFTPAAGLGLLLAACGAAPAAQQTPAPPLPDLSQLAPSDRALLQPRSFWYGVYVDGQKVGSSHSEAGFSLADGKVVYRRSSRLEMHTTSQGQPCVVVTAGEETYEIAPPFLLRDMRLMRTQQGETSTTTAVRDGRQLRVYQGDAHGERTRTMRAGDFGLRDTLAEMTWLGTDPAIGARLPVRSLDTDRLRLGRTTTTLLGKGDLPGADGPVRYFDVERTGATDGSIERERLGDDGGSLVWQLGSLELRREDRDAVGQGVLAVDLGQRGTVPVDRPIGDPRAVRGLELRVTGAPAGCFDDGPGQRVAEAGGVVTLTTGPELRAAADVRERREHSGETLRFPCRDADVVAMAAQAVGDADSDRVRVQRLCAFVADFVVDDPVICDHATVGQVIASRRGDCSDHALLFATLARALGLPARTVAGLVYAGDARQAFSPHEWCEVVVDGQWLAVDPMWNEVPANGTHLRLSPTAAASPPSGGFCIRVLAQR